jgi:hypothetical protein
MARSESSPDADPHRAGYQLEWCRCAVRSIGQRQLPRSCWHKRASSGSCPLQRSLVKVWAESKGKGHPGISGRVTAPGNAVR